MFFGDITALPAIAATLEKLPENTAGHAYIQIPNEQDKQVIAAPKGVKLHWLVTANKFTEDFLIGLKSLGNDISDTAIFIAAEASVVKQLKSHLNTSCEYDKTKLYASAYWNQKR